ncbi:MAG: hypothetical protein AB8B80_11545 [Marinicellaceae bacterium]
MRNFLKSNLPDIFEKDVHVKGAYKLNNKCVSTNVLIKRSKHFDGINKWVYIMSLSVLDKYSQIGQEGFYNFVIETSIEKGEVKLLDRWNTIQHWDLEDKNGMLNGLNETVIPWLVNYSNPQLVIEYLTAIESSVSSSISEDYINKFGCLITEEINMPPRVMRSYNGAIATIYESIGNFQKALDHLNKHRGFIEADLSPTCVDKSIIENNHKTIQLIDDGIKSLNDKLKTESTN